MSEIQISDLIQSAGAIGVLIFLVIQFLNGNLVTKGVVDRILKESEMRSTLLANALKDAIKEAVKEGMLEAQAEWNKRLLTSLPCMSETAKAKGQGAEAEKVG